MCLQPNVVDVGKDNFQSALVDSGYYKASDLPVWAAVLRLPPLKAPK